MVLIVALILIYTGFIGSRIYYVETKRKNLQSGDYCSVYLGENKLKGLIVQVNHEVDVWVLNVIIRFAFSLGFTGC